jgi:hypothetical protein
MTDRRGGNAQLASSSLEAAALGGDLKSFQKPK